MPEFVQRRIHERSARVLLNRPQLHNAFNEQVIAELTEAFSELGRDPEVRVVILAAEGASFCAGADINWMKKMVGYSYEENVADACTMALMLRTIRECPKPVIARVHGAAIGGGVGLVAACDMAVALSSAVFSLSEVKLGIIPAVISPYVLEKIGPAARRYALTAERFDGVEAKRIGLVSEAVAAEDQLDVWIAERTGELLKAGPQALAACKAVLRDVQGATADTAQIITTQRIAEQRVSSEGQEGLGAFLQKRRPAWVPGQKPRE